MLTAAQVVLTVAAAGFGLVPVAADFNRTHATNPLWTGHARFHAVWLGLCCAGLALLALALLWAPASDQLAHARLAALITSCIAAGFFGAVLARPIYGGHLNDENGHQPVTVAVPGGSLRVDANVGLFSSLLLVLAGGWILILAA